MGKKVILELVRHDLQQLVAHVPHARAIGISVIDAQPDEAWVKVPYSRDLIGNPESGVVHGGVITTLLDNCAGLAVMAALEEPLSIATLDLRIDYMKPATPHLDIVAHSHCYKMTRNVAFVRGTAYHPKRAAPPRGKDSVEDPIATCVGTFMLGANRSLPAVLNGAF